MSTKDEHRATKHQSPPEPPAATEGVFKRPKIAKSVTSLIGNNVKVKTKNGATYEGVFSSLNSDYELIVSLSHEIGPDDHFVDRVRNGEIAFNPDDILSISCVNVNLKEALDLSQRFDQGDYPPQRDTIDQWDENRSNDPGYVDKSWNDLFRERKEGNQKYEDLADYGSVLAFEVNSKSHDNIDLNLKPYECPDRGEYPKPQRKNKISAETQISEDANVRPEKTSTLNPYAKPFTPKEPTEKESAIHPLATVVLPTYVVNPEGPRYGKLDQLSGTPSLQNQYMPYTPYSDGYDEKYSSYDSVPLTPHDYQQYYPHLQYIQYFRRFY